MRNNISEDLCVILNQHECLIMPFFFDEWQIMSFLFDEDI